jgi:threonine dehydratase
VTLDELRAAAERLRGISVRTPLVPLRSEEPAPSLWLKVETHQPVGSFKIRGVYNAVAQLDPRARERGISTVSAGNTAQALAWCGRKLGVPARSVMPDTAPRTKIDAMRRLGGEPVLVPVAEVFRYLTERLFEREPYAFVHPWTDRNLHVGHGTLALEILEDLPEVETVYVPVGGGGLLGGVGSALRELAPRVRIVAVEPEGCAALHASLAAGHPMRVPCKTMCDGVAVPYITDEMFPVLRELVDEMRLVSERSVRRTIRRLALRDRLVVEGAGALALAAALEDGRRTNAVCMVTGGSIDTPALVEILSDESLELD